LALAAVWGVQSIKKFTLHTLLLYTEVLLALYTMTTMDRYIPSIYFDAFDKKVRKIFPDVVLETGM